MSQASNRSIFFYQGDKLITLMQGNQHHAIFRHDAVLLAEQKTGVSESVSLLATDEKGSVLSVKDADEEEPHALTAYGHDPSLPSHRTLLGFNGERIAPLSNDYPLGKGYRNYSPSTMRFNISDALSPFGAGGPNAYAYCSGDPINHVDPSGSLTVKQLLKARSNRPPLKTAASRERHPLGFDKALAASNPTETVPKDFRLVGYHGSLKKHEQSLAEGISLQGSTGNTMGDGFYFSSRRDIASLYPGDGSGESQVFGVYAKNFTTLNKGRDFDYLGGSKDLFVVYPKAFDRFIVRAEIKGTLIRRNSYSDNNANRRR